MRWMPEERFQRLLVKAFAEGVTLTDMPDSEFVKFASSGTDKVKRYIVSEHGCSCMAAASGLDCKHYALYQLDQLPRLVETYGIPDWIMESLARSEK